MITERISKAWPLTAVVRTRESSPSLLRFERSDLSEAPAASDEIFDIGLDDLEWLPRRAEEQAMARRKQAQRKTVVMVSPAAE
ncbi:MAG TPA: hypothetical protein VFM32_11175 [Spongiibacteraceae bacterium]|nr:hypothetical protein [Spongiibacteraceae bacterium]